MTTHFVIADPKRCIGCYTCMPACVVVHEAAGLQAHPRLHVTHTPHGTMPMQCRHCEDAPCSKACPAGCFTITDEVQLNESLCIGCKMCMIACPFGVIEPYGTPTQNEQMPIEPYAARDGAVLPFSSHTNTRASAPLGALLTWTAGVRTVAVKCDLCHFREEGPACIQVCPTKTLRVVEHGNLQLQYDEKALFDAALKGGLVERVAAPLAMVMLAITGALAAMCFVKAFGITFLGTPRDGRAAGATEVDRAMLGGMGILAVCCVLFGLGAPLVAPVVRNAAAPLAGAAPAVVQGLTVYPGDPAQAVVSPALLAVLLAGLLGVPVALSAYYAAERPPRRVATEMWAAGYAPDSSMLVSAFGFGEPIRVMFRPLYALRSRTAVVSARTEKELGGTAVAALAGPEEGLQVAAGDRSRRFAAYGIASLVLLLLFAALLLVVGGR